MSTDKQQHSIENQSEVIAQYAARRGLTIVRSYEDAGRSGLRIARRDALKDLISDVGSGRADFKVILVYDVSRWGRFQDCDESAYYEFTCRKAGIAVEYCAEQFENDGSLTATVLKNIKRAMAGEFSRELSTKVFAGQSRIAAKGFHTGATPGYGLRRFLVDEHGNRKRELAFGQWKSIQTERVILMPGPPEEIEIVHRVNDLFIDQKQSLKEIAKTLNAQGVPNVIGRAWTRISVNELLTNEKYMGNCIYNRTSKKLSTKSRRNPSQEWVRAVGAFDPIISPHRFRQAQQQLEENNRPYSDNELLDALRAIWREKGSLNKDVIEACKGSPAVGTYRKHFGGLMNAYQRIGYKGTWLASRGTNLNLRKAILNDIAAHVAELGGSVRPLAERCQILVNEELTVAVVVGRTAPSAAVRGVNLGLFHFHSQRKPDILIVARIDDATSGVKDYFVLPFIFLPRGNWATVSGLGYKRLEDYRAATLAPFYELCARQPLGAR